MEFPKEVYVNVSGDGDGDNEYLDISSSALDAARANDRDTLFAVYKLDRLAKLDYSESAEELTEA